MSLGYLAKLIVLLGIIFICKCAEDYYKILGVPRNASKRQIKKAFNKLSLKYHPDKFKDKREKERAKQQFIKISNAYEALYDEEKRKIYDQYGEEGLKQNAQSESQGQGFNSNGFNYHFNGGSFGSGGTGASFHGFGDFSFEDIFQHFHGGRRGGRKRTTINFGRGGGFQEPEEEPEEKNYFDQTDVIELKMDNLSKLYSRNEIWFVLFFKNDKHFNELKDLIIELARQTYGIFKVGAINCQAHEEICEEFSVKKANVIYYFPENGTKEVEYKGQKKWEKIFSFGSSKMQNFVRVINSDNYDDFISSHQGIYKVLLFTAKKSTPPLFKALSKHFLGKLSFGEVRQTEKELISKFNIQKIPSILVITNEEEYKGVEYHEHLTRDSLQKFLNKYAYKKNEFKKDSEIKEITNSIYLTKCNKKNGKKLCLIYVAKKSTLDDAEIQMLKSIEKKYIKDPVLIYYVIPEKHKFFWDSFEDEDKNSQAIIVKGKRKKYLALKGTIDLQSVGIIDNILGGGGSMKNLLSEINFTNKKNVEMQQDL